MADHGEATPAEAVDTVIPMAAPRAAVTTAALRARVFTDPYPFRMYDPAPGLASGRIRQSSRGGATGQRVAVRPDRLRDHLRSAKTLRASNVAPQLSGRRISESALVGQ